MVVIEGDPPRNARCRCCGALAHHLLYTWRTGYTRDIPVCSLCFWFWRDGYDMHWTLEIEFAGVDATPIPVSTEYNPTWEELEELR